MAAFLPKPKPPKMLPAYNDGSSNDTDSDDDLSLCDLPIRAPSPARPFTASSPSAAKDGRCIGHEATESDDDSDPFEFFSFRINEPAGIRSPSARVFFGGATTNSTTTTLAPAPSTTNSTTTPSTLLGKTTGNSISRNNSNESKPVPSAVIPPVPLSRRSRSEAARRPPRDPVAYNRSASLEGRGKAWGECFRTADKKGEYRRLPPLRASTSQGRSAPCTVDAVPSCGPRPKWYVFATFATVKPPQGGMDMKDMRTRQQKKKRSTQQQQRPLEGVVGGATARLAASRGGGRPGTRNSWLLNSLSCRVDVDSLPWTPSDLPMMPFPGGLTTHLEGAPRWR